MALKLRLGLHLGFAINRYPEAEEWSRIADELGVKHVQFVSGLLQPDFPKEVIDNQIRKVKRALKEHNLICEHTFTSPRENFMAHPDEHIAAYWLKWFKDFATISRKIGAISTGCLAGIYSVKDLRERRDEIFNRTIKGWHELARYGKKTGLRYLTWEPMSVKREMGETISEAKRMHDALNKGSALPVKMALDVDHGDLSSPNPNDTDPYAWIRSFGAECLFLHLKQSSADKSGHHPFTEKWNKEGRIFPEEVIEALDDGGAKDVILFFELGWREREPHDSNVVKELKESVNYWREYVSE